MTATTTATATVASLEEIQQGWHDLAMRVRQLEAEKEALEKDNKALKLLLERTIEHRQKSHTELVLLLTGLVSKLPISDVGVIVSKLVEHNTNASQYLAALIKGTVDAQMPQPEILRTLDHAKHDLEAALKPVVEELIRLDAPLERSMLEAVLKDADQYFTPAAVRAYRCYVKGQLPRERIVREFGPEALIFFNDLTTDPKFNPRPKPDEIVLGFKNDFPAVIQQNPGVIPQKRQELQALCERVQRSRGDSPEGQQQRNAFQRLAFLVDLLYYYQHQNTEPPEPIFAQRLPALVEQLVLADGNENEYEKRIVEVEGLLAHVVSSDHRQMILNNIGKSTLPGKRLKFILKLRSDKVPDLEQVITDFIKHLIPDLKDPPTPEKLAVVLKLISPEIRRLVVKGLLHSDRVRKEEAGQLGKALCSSLCLSGVMEELKAQTTLTPEVERKLAWGKVKEMIVRREDTTAIAAAIRDRLHSNYNADEIRDSWLVLAEAEPLSLIRVFCQLPYLANGKTDPIARTVMEIYVTRLAHEKYAAIHHKVVNSLKSMFKARPDSPIVLNFVALVRWVSPEVANKLSLDIGLPVSG